MLDSEYAYHKEKHRQDLGAGVKSVNKRFTWQVLPNRDVSKQAVHPL